MRSGIEVEYRAMAQVVEMLWLKESISQTDASHPEKQEEPGGQFVLTPRESSYPLTDILNKKMAVASYKLKDVGVLDTERKNCMEEDSSPNVTSCSSMNSLEHNTTETEVDNLQQDGTIDDDASHQRHGMEKKRSPGNCQEAPDSPLVVSREILDTRVVQEANNTLLGSADCNTSSACCPEPADSCQEMGVTSNSDGENEQLPDEDSIPTPGMQHQKRQKALLPPPVVAGAHCLHLHISHTLLPQTLLSAMAQQRRVSLLLARLIPKKPIFFYHNGYEQDQFVDHGDEMKASSEGASLPFGLSYGFPHGAFGRG
ncbi:hypothetical protein Taro_010870 [Colocasia esculenta]|uniref:Uncharacterized protein n=1 Tax=Colocasia esculenta TaxID=4460 RepID=A0A843U4I4_COLES|nr:hypothetical protein [Colocasia esculenta]